MENVLKERVGAQLSFHPVTRVGARVISYLFHPLFIPLYVIYFVVYELRAFPDRDDWGRKLVMAQFFVSYTLLPLITVLLMKALGFIQSIHLHTQRDRILPFVVCEIFYFWGWYVSRNLHYPKLVTLFALGVFLACSLGLMLNIVMKVSLHAIAMGTLCAFTLFAGMMVSVHLGLFIALAFLIAGLTLTARLIDSNHTTAEVYMGFVCGFLTLALAYLFV